MPSSPGGYPSIRDLKWSHEEKTIARKAFNQALERELGSVMHKAKQMASAVEKPADLWKLEDYLRRRREKIDDKYDYRYSVLPLVLGNLIREGHLREEDLHGLGEDKLGYIRSYVRIAEEFR